jgi:hypothetical protein
MFRLKRWKIDVHPLHSPTLPPDYANVLAEKIGPAA